MKILFLLSLVLLFFSACNKTEDPDLPGKWKIETVTGGISGNGYDAEFEFLNFIDNKNCEWLDSTNTVIGNGTYKLSISNDDKCIKFKIKNKSTSFYFDLKQKYFFQSNDTITMEPCFECNDCFGYLYVKQN